MATYVYVQYDHIPRTETKHFPSLCVRDIDDLLSVQRADGPAPAALPAYRHSLAETVKYRKLITLDIIQTIMQQK